MSATKTIRNKALIVGAPDTLRSSLSSALDRQEHIAYEFVSTLREALQLAETFLPTVLVHSVKMNIFLDDETGQEDPLGFIVMMRKHASTRDVPIVVLSQGDSDEERERALALGATVYLGGAMAPGRLADQIRVASETYLKTLRQSTAAFASDVEHERPRVLMIDGSQEECLAARKKLHGAGVLFLGCNYASKAVAVIRRFLPTVILMDISMPRMKNFELLESLRNDPIAQDIPIIIYSDEDDPDIKSQAFSRGANDYAEKQTSIVELTSRITLHTRAYRNAQLLDRAIQDMRDTEKRLEIQRDFIRKTFGRYLSDEIVTSILETPDGLELGGEKRSVSILMADLRGFTSLSESLAPEAVLSILNNYLSTMTEILTKHSGTIDDFIGDAILAVFGAPVRRPDDAQRAVACAVEMQLAMERVNDWNRDNGFPEVTMGIGVNSGEVVVGNIGSERRAKYGVVGQHVNLTSRVEACTVGGQILITQSTRKACGDILRLDNTMDVLPKGIKAPITIYEVGGVGEPFDLFLETKERTELPRLTRPLHVTFSELEGKRSARGLQQGQIIRMRHKEAVLETDADLDLLTDLRLILFDEKQAIISGEVYAKVTGMGDACVAITFTMVPPEAAAFLAANQPEIDSNVPRHKRQTAEFPVSVESIAVDPQAKDRAPPDPPIRKVDSGIYDLVTDHPDLIDVLIEESWSQLASASEDIEALGNFDTMVNAAERLLVSLRSAEGDLERSPRKHDVTRPLFQTLEYVLDWVRVGALFPDERLVEALKMAVGHLVRLLEDPQDACGSGISEECRLLRKYVDEG